MMYFRRSSVFFLACCFLISAASVFAQSDVGNIAGTVIDPSGAVVSGAKVTATNSGTGVVSKAVTGSGGSYTIPFLKPGNYQVTVEQTGFKTFVQTGIIVEIGQTAAVSVTLALGQVSQTVEVRSQGAQLQTQTSDIGLVVSSQQIEDLPLAGQSEVRTPAAFLMLDSMNQANGTASGNEGPGGWRTYDTTVAGSENAATEWDVEGARVANGGWTSANYSSLGFPPEAVGEFKVMAVNPDAEYGNSAGGVVSFEYRSGTNQLHGEAYDFTRNDAFNARGFYVPNRTSNKQDEFGANLGGPIRKDKTFFFGWYNGFRLDLGAPGTLETVPTAAMKEGDFTGYGTGTPGTSDFVQIPIYDPTTTASDGKGGYTRQQMSCNGVLNVMCSIQNKFASSMLSAWPNPTVSNPNQIVNNYLPSGVDHVTENEWGAKIDHTISANNKIYGSFATSTIVTPPSPQMPGLMESQGTSTSGTAMFRLDEDFILRPNLVNHAVFGYNRQDGGTSCVGCPSNGWPGKNSFPGIPADGPDPQLYFNDESNVGGAGGPGSYSNSNNFEANDTLSWIKGKHDLKFGFQYIHFAINAWSPGNLSGQFRFNSPETADPATGVGGSGFASYLFGWVDYATVSVNLAEEAQRSATYAGFVQDDWKITRKLTINAGLRYDLSTPFTDNRNAMQWETGAVHNPAAGNLLGAMVAATPSERTNAGTWDGGVGPRLGLAYALDDKTVIRSSYGLIVGSASSARVGWSMYQQGFSATNNLYASTGAITPAFYMNNGWPASSFAAPPFTSQAGFLEQSVNEMEPGDAKQPYMQQWTIDIQRQIPSHMLLDVSYIGVKGTHLPSWDVPTNNMPPQYLSYGNLLQANLSTPAAQALAPIAAMPIDPATGNHSPFAGFEAAYSQVNGAAPPLSQALVQYPQYGQIVKDTETAGDSTWNALRINLSKHFSNGLSFLVSYTWSKDLSDSSDSTQDAFENNVQDEWNTKLAKDLSENDVPNNLVISYSYELPFGPGKRFVNQRGAVGKIVGGWKIAGVQHYQSGQAISIWNTTSTCRLESSYCGFQNVDEVPQTPVFSMAKLQHWGHSFDPNVDLYANPAAFTAPAPYTFGTAEQDFGNLRAPSFIDEDFSIWKDTQVNERVRIEFHADFVNAFNRTQFSIGDSFGGSNYNIWVINQPGFGQLTGQANYPRNIQLGMKVVF